MSNVITLNKENKEIREKIIEAGGSDVYKCYQCGKCTGVCPWYQIETVELPVCRIAQTVRLGAMLISEDKEETAKETEEVYRCVGCDACVNECPHGVSIPDIIRAIRSILVNFGSYPSTLKSPISKIHNVGNPLGEPKEKRVDWAEGLDIPIFEAGIEFLYFPGCLPAYDPRLRKVAQATAQILKKAGVSFGILGEKEWCCCEAMRRAGAEYLFQEAVKTNIDAFKSAGVKKIVTTSPHCYTTFKNDYPEFGGDFEIIHTTQIFYELIKQKKLVPQGLSGLENPSYNDKTSHSSIKRVVYHDPCTLGRQSGIYDEPREVLKSIPSIELVEIENFSREYSLCCGGGSGGLWLDWPKEERIADVRVQQAVDTGAEILAVACPYCLQMFEDSVKTVNISIEVKDISELLADSIKR